MDREEQAQAIRERIELAFADVPMPSREWMVQFGNLDEVWGANCLAGQPRHEVSVTETLPGCLLFMPMPAVHYYLPVFLEHFLRPTSRGESLISQQVIGFLDRRSTKRYPEFSPTQNQCIVDWLGFVIGNIEAFNFGRFRDRFARRIPLIRAQWTKNENV